LFHPPMILFNEIIQVLAGSDFYSLRKFAHLLMRELRRGKKPAK
jgi:hypothetical protein